MDRESLAAGHETKEANAKGIMWFGIGMIVSAVIMHLCLGAMFFSLRAKSNDRARHATDPSLVALRHAPPPPLLQTNPQADLEAYLAKERKLLSSYGPVPGRTDVVRIPIERAMEVLVRKGAGGSHE